MVPIRCTERKQHIEKVFYMAIGFCLCGMLVLLTGAGDYFTPAKHPMMMSCVASAGVDPAKPTAAGAGNGAQEASTSGDAPDEPDAQHATTAPAAEEVVVPPDVLESFLTLHVAPEVPLRKHDSNFLVAMGVLTMDTPNCFTRRERSRATWMQYRDVWSETHPKGRVLVKFVVAKHPNHNYTFSNELLEEAKTSQGDIVALTSHEGRPSQGKTDSASYGLWGLEADVKGISVKSYVWRRVAIAAYRAQFVAKADDDVFVVVPRYIATLTTLPETGTYWGLASHCRLNPFNSSTKFPYVYGMLVTLSHDLATTVAISDHLSQLLAPYSGRPSDYVLQQLDREDFMIGGALYRANKAVSVYNDCRYVEPSYYTLGRDVDLDNYGKYRFSYAVMFHKLPLSEYQSTFKQYKDRRYSAGEFIETAYDVPGSRWFIINGQCKSMMLDNCLTFTGWKELGPLEWKLLPPSGILSAEKENYLISKNCYLNLTSMSSIVIMLGVLTLDTPMESPMRHSIRDACYGKDLLWSPQKPKNPIVLRFVVGKNLHYNQNLSPGIKAESVAHGDILSLRHKEGGRRGPRRDIIKILQYFNTVLKVSRCPFVGVMHGGPTFPFQLLLNVLHSLPKRRVFLGNGAVVSYKGSVFPVIQDGLAVLSRDVAQAISKPASIPDTEKVFRFASDARTFELLGNAVRLNVAKDDVSFYHDCRFTSKTFEKTQNATQFNICSTMEGSASGAHAHGDGAVSSIKYRKLSSSLLQNVVHVLADEELCKPMEVIFEKSKFHRG